ncbi:terpene synthase family protein [Streptomyces sp. NBC_01304]|uniref:terpene synthase family protein n=1 Tax=Streptomyces sp. NBC_01304 TaxID=2903818 RepID=UPI002E130753|nr:hypothetical protein OG430_00410 [Streptomyces sp. NBC_01304]
MPTDLEHRTRHLWAGFGITRAQVAAAADFVEALYGGSGEPPLSDRRIVLTANCALGLWMDDQMELHSRPAQLGTCLRHQESLLTGFGDSVALDWWRASHDDYAAALESEREWLTGPVDGDIDHYLSIAESSIGATALLATLCLLHDTGTAHRLDEPELTALLRELGSWTRLSNDLGSLDRDRARGDRANAVLVLQPAMGLPDATAFVEQLSRRHRRAIHELLRRMPPDDQLRDLIRNMIRALEHAYRLSPRYADNPVTDSGAAG